MGKNASPDEAERKDWETTGVPNLLRRSNGIYYARVAVNGVRRVASLGTNLRSVAIARLRDRMEEAESARISTTGANARTDLSQLTGADCERLFLERVEANPDLAPDSKRHARDGCKRVRATWPGFEAVRVSRITERDCKSWLERARVTPTTPGNGQLRAGGPPSPTLTNRAIRALRGMLEAGVEAGALARNPALGLRTTATRRRLPNLPDSKQFPAILAAMRAKKGNSVLAAEFAEGLALTGMRLNEAAALCWQHVDLLGGRLLVPGTKTDTSRRVVPLIPAAQTLFTRLKQEAEEVGTCTPTSSVFAVSECQKSLTAACEAVGAARLVHHDLRHLFATRCIESGVDIPTVSRWLGHADGGALAMRVYGHLRDEHSRAAAAKVNFQV